MLKLFSINLIIFLIFIAYIVFLWGINLGPQINLSSVAELGIDQAIDGYKKLNYGNLDHQQFLVSNWQYDQDGGTISTSITPERTSYGFIEVSKNSVQLEKKENSGDSFLWQNGNVVFFVNYSYYSAYILERLIKWPVFYIYIPCLLFSIIFTIIFKCHFPKIKQHYIKLIYSIFFMFLCLSVCFFWGKFFGEYAWGSISLFSQMNRYNDEWKQENNNSSKIKIAPKELFKYSYGVIQITSFKYLIFSDNINNITQINPIVSSKQINSNSWLITYSKWNAIQFWGCLLGGAVCLAICTIWFYCFGSELKHKKLLPFKPICLKLISLFLLITNCVLIG